MRAFRAVTAPAAVLDRAEVDTDQIVPKQFLKRIERSGFGEFLFYDWAKDPTFELNRPEAKGAKILLTGRNFGCGSSREHAPWALLEYGFRAIVAPSFADIFANNCTKNGVLPVALSDETVAEIMRRAEGEEGYELTVDLVDRLVRDASGLRAPFHVDEFRRYCLLEGLDDIGLTLRHESCISEYESRRPRVFDPHAA